MEHRDNRPQGITSALTASVSRYIKLLLEDTRLNVTEKITRLLSALTLCALLLVLAIAALLFLSIAACRALGDVMNPIWAYIIIAAFYALLAVIVFLGKNTLIVNPIARFVSRLLLEAPENPAIGHDKSSSIS